MSNVIEELIEDGRLEGLSRGIIETCKEFGCSKEEIVLKRMEKLSVSQNEAEKCVEERAWWDFLKNNRNMYDKYYSGARVISHLRK